MRSLHLITLLTAGALALGACSGTAATTAPTTAPTAAPASAAPPSSATPSGGSGAGLSVAIKNFAYDPATATLAAPGTVVWANSDSVPHTVTFDDSAMKSSVNLNNGDTFSATFDKAGTYAYHCTVHPSMKGTVTVS